jgi:hypothetical protein
MTSRHDRLRLHDLDSPTGTMRVPELQGLPVALLTPSERADRV